jgi:hypothetical protein
MVMLIGGVPFDRTSGIDLTRGPDGQPVLVTPHLGHANPRGRKLHKYGSGPFSDLVLSELPRQPGVYAIRDDGGRVRYIGRARDSFAKRWGSTGYQSINAPKWFVGGQETTCRINGLIVKAITSGASLSLYTHLTDDPVPLEEKLIRALRPPWNLRIPFDPLLVNEYI